MDARARFRRTCRFAPVDRFCIRNMGHWPETLTAWIAQGLEPADAGKVHGNDPSAGVGVELGSTYRSPFWPRFERQVTDQDGQYYIERDEHGRVKRWKQGTRPELAQYLRFPVQTADDWEQVRWRLDPNNGDRYGRLAEFAQAHGGMDGRDYAI